MIDSKRGIHCFLPNPYNIRFHFESTNNCDVTDNKCDTTVPFNQLKNSIMSDPDTLYREDERLKTFADWTSFIDKYVLAQTGMYFTHESDKVKCYFCEVEIGQWEETDNPVSEHMRWSPNCPLIRRRTTNNIPLNAEELNRVLPPVSYDVCGGNDAIEIRPSSYPEGSISSANVAQPYFPDFPEYAIESARMRSFNEWPRIMKQKPEVLSEAGFFYTGIGDRVKCFSCGGGLKDWDDNDDPWEQHALWLSNCRYLKLVKGQNYIDSVIAKFKNEENVVLNNITKPEPLSCLNTNENVAVNAIADVKVRSEVGNDLEKNLPKAKKVIPEEKLCKICYSEEYNAAFLPCGHVVACAKCASSVTKCPMCRKPFTDIMRVYFS